MQMANILIVDDEPCICDMLAKLVRRMGHEAACAHTLEAGMATVLASPCDAVLLDVQMPDGNGLHMLPKIRNCASSPEVIIMTGFGSSDGAELAIKNGAWDYIQKDDSPTKIKLLLQRVLQYRGTLNSVSPPARALHLDGIIGGSEAMRACYDQVAQAAVSDAGVLLTGETGTGKELFAFAIHSNSDRAASDFVVVDCAALPETLVESVLFGHEKGAYTGADHARQGLVGQAHRGTLFLDEIGELPPAVQKVFLRVLQEHRYRPVGARREVESAFRLIAATNCDLDAMSRNGTFRKDLLFRIRSLCIHLPPLRARGEDIKALTNHHIVRTCERREIDVKGTSPDFHDIMGRYGWPGNVRELINALENAISAAHNEDILFSRHIPEYIRIQVAKASLPRESAPVRPMEKQPLPDGLPSFKSHRRKVLAQAEKAYLERLTALTRGDVRAACRISRLSRSRFYELIRHYGISLS